MQPNKPFSIDLRPHQAEILSYTQGKMGVLAVPGSGKTWTLSLLAAELLKRNVLEQDQEILIVTLINSAVNNFYQRVSQFVEKEGLIPNIGYRVRTLHGLANDIVRERPDLTGLESNFQIIDESEANNIRAEVSRAWLNNHPDYLDEFLNIELEPERLEWVRRERLPELVQSIALAYIRYAKDHRETPERLAHQLEILPFPFSLARMGNEIYAGYQRALVYRGAVDFDDLIRHALLALESDPELINRLRHRWPYILEDEAQDSSSLQEQILSLLCGPVGNWVRVGDPNQAIYETFTTANPNFLREFSQRPDVIARFLPTSGRSTSSIINLANNFTIWTNEKHPNPQVRDALSTSPLIEPTGENDPQPNPPDSLSNIKLIIRKFSPAQEIQAVADSIEGWLPDHPNQTVAALAPRNQRAFDLVDELRRRSLPYLDDFLRSSHSTRTSAGSLAHLLRHLADPQSASKLAQAFQVWRRDDRTDPAQQPLIQRATDLLRKIIRNEDYIWPTPGHDWLAESLLRQTDTEAHLLLEEYRLRLQRWHGSIILPIDQLLLFLSQDILTNPAELAVAHKLALLMRQTSLIHPEWHLPQLTNELVAIAKNERRFLGFSDTDTGFDPEAHRGVVVVSTIHKAKGLEWDRVYLLSVNNYDFPSGDIYDHYMPEKWFLRNELNLEAETLGQFKAAITKGLDAHNRFGIHTLQSRVDYIRERLRLIYVGITRARKELIISWNTGRNGDLFPAQALLALAEFRDQPEEVA